MSRPSEYHLGASSSSPPFRQFGEFSEEEECDVIAKKKKKATIEQQQQNGMEEGTPLQFQNEQEGKKKEEYVKIQEEGTPMQFQHNNLGSKKEEHVTTQVEPDAPPMPGVAGIWFNAVLIILLVAEVILGLDFFGVI